MSLFTQTLRKGGDQQETHKQKEMPSQQEQLAASREITVRGAAIKLMICGRFWFRFWNSVIHKYS